MENIIGRPNWIALSTVALVVFAGACDARAQRIDAAAVVRGIDAAVKARVDNIAQYTVDEHYSVYRNKDEAHPVAEMTVKTDYRQDTGKTYTILSQSGSDVIRNLVLKTILENEKRLNTPGVREGSWITSANYNMTLLSTSTEKVGNRDCLVLSIEPKRKAPFLIDGKLWVDARDFSIVQLQGTSSKSPSVFSGPTAMMRQYEEVSGFSEATHARAVSNSFMFGETVVTIDYRGYQVQLRAAK